ncbi:VENN motif pre-toxin domain-containing protein [Dickeya fangzhongdai]|uniref:VENN motif pre-toxin domain-containing protein n=1 Tax=Dickeya fangzhongdai TaxID=1778540 RepID=UPI0013C5337E|nr:VENN motif pre-toxin domain-containing protein [Dickeya fangzhongdai]
MPQLAGGTCLLVRSEQDSDRYDSKQQSVSAGVTIPIYGGGGGASFSFSRDKVHSNFDSVQEQSGLFAGSNGFDVTVGNHTQLDGGAIASTASAERNRLETGTLGLSNIDNRAEYSASHTGGGFSTSAPVGLQVLSNVGGLMLAGANQSGSSAGTTYAAVSDGTLVIRNPTGQQQDVSGLSRDTAGANSGALNPIFDKEKVESKLRQAQLLSEIGAQVLDIASAEGTINATKDANAGLAATSAEKRREKAASLAQASPDKVITQDDVTQALYQDYYHASLNASPYRTGGPVRQGIQAVTAALQGVLAGNVAHALLGAVVAESGGNSALAGAAGEAGGELAARALLEALYPGKKPDELNEDQKQLLSTLSTIAGGLAAGVAGNSGTDAVQGAQSAQVAVENNYLSNQQKAQKKKELEECQTQACKVQAEAKWTAIDLGQDGSFAAGMVAGVPAGLYDTIDGIVKTASSPMETYEALKSLFNSGDVLGNVSDAVKQSYIDRINNMEAEYQKAGASGSFNAGVEGGKLVTDIAGLLAGGTGVVKVTAGVTEKIVAKVAGKVAGKAESAAAGFIGNEAHNAASYAGLKLDLQTTQAANDVVDSLRTTGTLPSNYVDKAQAVANGWKPGKALNNTNPGGQLGGDIFENSNNLLPSSPGRVWREADIGLNNTMSRSNQPGTRLLYSSDGLLYITTDHYETATSIGKWK